MKRRTTEKLTVLSVTAALFAVGVYALSLDRGNMRTTLLACCFAGLLAIAVRQTLQKTKR